MFTDSLQPNQFSGYVYEVLFQNTDNNSKFLVQIIIKDVVFNSKVQKLAFFKDVTFGFMYDEIKAEESLQQMVINTMQQKINLPLEQIIDGCNKILNSNQFKVLTKYSNSDNLQDQLEVMKAQS